MKKSNVTATKAVHHHNDNVSWLHGISLVEYNQNAPGWRRRPPVCTQGSLGPCQFMNMLITMDPIVNVPSDYSNIRLCRILFLALYQNKLRSSYNSSSRD